jgi:hypothetical protein
MRTLIVLRGRRPGTKKLERKRQIAPHKNIFFFFKKILFQEKNKKFK